MSTSKVIEKKLRGGADSAPPPPPPPGMNRVNTCQTYVYQLHYIQKISDFLISDI